MQLDRAINHQNIELLQILIEEGIDLNFDGTSDEMTPLLKAISLGNLKIVRLFLQAGASLDKIGSYEYTPLALAAKLGNVKIVEHLLYAGAEVDFSGYESPLYLAVTHNHIQVIKILISAGANVNFALEDNYTVLMRAAQLGYIEVAKLLVKAGADVNAVNRDGGTALSIAAENGEEEIFEYLDRLTSNLQQREYAALRLPSGILRKTKREDKFTSTLFRSVKESNYSAVRESISAGININAIEEDGNTALHLAASRGDLAMVNILIKAGANYEIRDELDEWTPLMSSAFSGQTEVVKTLIETGADVNACDRDGNTALILAITRQPKFSFKLPVKGKWLETVQVLILGGANVNLQNQFGKKALSLALEAGHTEIVGLLKEAGATEN